VRLNRHASWATPCGWLACIEVEGLNDERRAVLIERLRKRGVDTRPYFYPMSRMPYLKAADTPVAHAVSERGLNLPTYIGLTRAEVAEISGVIREEMESVA